MNNAATLPIYLYRLWLLLLLLLLFILLMRILLPLYPSTYYLLPALFFILIAMQVRYSCCLLLLIHTFSVLSLQLKKLRRHNKSAIDLSNANLACGDKRGTKVNGSHHGDNPLLRPTGIQIATKSDAALKAMAPTNIKTVHQTSLLHIESNLDRLGLLSPTHDQRSQQQIGQIALQPVLINTSKFLKATHCTKIRKLEYRGPWWWIPWAGEAGARASIQPSKAKALRIPEKHHESCPFAATCGPRRKK